MSNDEANEILVIRRWIKTLAIYFLYNQLPNEECVGLFTRIVQIYGAAKNNFRDICKQCILCNKRASGNWTVKIDDLLKGGAVDTVLEEIQQSTLNNDITHDCLRFFMNVSYRLKEKKGEEDDELEEAKRKITKMEIYEKLEEEGYEDNIKCLLEALEHFERYYCCNLSLNACDYFVFV
ncbi:uncharacterized protein MONOS_18633 [Monocercomonoides exilis]|uniref:uncharacterized protein n=1 Tax=Monocercomonoides exilis TaxID=2049356 RepID=UPI003559C482|nr:hypothetical protein MONOS_18633 [Monocercomonoides exilis]